MGRPDRHVTMLDIYLLNLLYLYVYIALDIPHEGQCPSQTPSTGLRHPSFRKAVLGVSVQAYRLVGKKGHHKNGLRLGRSELYLRAQSQRHHTIDRFEEGGMKRGNARRSSFNERERVIVS